MLDLIPAKFKLVALIGALACTALVAGVAAWEIKGFKDALELSEKETQVVQLRSTVASQTASIEAMNREAMHMHERSVQADLDSKKVKTKVITRIQKVEHLPGKSCDEILEESWKAAW